MQQLDESLGLIAGFAGKGTRARPLRLRERTARARSVFFSTVPSAAGPMPAGITIEE